MSDREVEARRGRGRVAQALVGTVLGAACLWLAMRGVSAHAVVEAFTGARPEWIVLASLLLFVSYGMRSLRWGIILHAPSGSMPALYWSTGLGYFLNSVAPARAGDIARSATAGRALSLDTARVLGSTVVERIVDATVLALALLVAVPFVGELPDWLISTAVLVGAACLGALIAVTAAVRMSRRREEAVDRPRSRIIGMAARFGAGLLLVDTTARAARVTASTACVWGIDVLLAMALARAFDVPLDPLEALVLLAAFGLASAAPSTPGFVGVYQAIAVGVLVPFGVAHAPAIAIATALQIVTLATSLAATGLGGALARASANRQPGTSIPGDGPTLATRG